MGNLLTAFIVAETVSLDHLYHLIGKIIVYLLIFAVFTAVILSILVVYSFKTGNFIFPRFMILSISLLEGMVKALFRFFRMSDDIVDDVGIKLKNQISLQKLKKVPFDRRVIFFPQCLRSVDCPAKLSPEGLACIECGQCDLGKEKRNAQDLGYMVFIVPGSSFIKRVVRKYKPDAILGVGCKMEVKDGLDLCQRLDVPGIGIVLSKDGCISTILDWDMFYDVIDLEE